MALEEAAQPVKREWVPNPDGPRDIYCNFVDASWTIFDIRILFGQLKPAALNSDDFTIQEQTAVTMSWAQAKNALAMLAGVVESYEKVNGEIPQLKLAPGSKGVSNEG